MIEILMTTVGMTASDTARYGLYTPNVTVAIDGRCLGPILTGTQQNVLETVKTLCSNDAIGLVNLYVSDGLPSYADTELRNLPKLKILEANNAPLDARMKSDIAYRPYQVSSSSDIEWLRFGSEWD